MPSITLSDVTSYPVEQEVEVTGGMSSWSLLEPLGTTGRHPLGILRLVKDAARSQLAAKPTKEEESLIVHSTFTIGFNGTPSACGCCRLEIRW